MRVTELEMPGTLSVSVHCAFEETQAGQHGRHPAELVGAQPSIRRQGPGEHQSRRAQRPRSLDGQIQPRMTPHRSLSPASVPPAPPVAPHLLPQTHPHRAHYRAQRTHACARARTRPRAARSQPVPACRGTPVLLQNKPTATAPKPVPEPSILDHPALALLHVPSASPALAPSTDIASDYQTCSLADVFTYALQQSGLSVVFPGRRCICISSRAPSSRCVSSVSRVVLQSQFPPS